MRIDENNVTWVRNSNGSADWYYIPHEDYTTPGFGEKLK